MAKFKENHSGLIYEFVHPYDVDQMKKHPDYTEVSETETQVQPIEQPEVKEKRKYTKG